MQVQNTTDNYVSFTARLNPGEKVKGHDAHGNSIVKDALPQLRTVTIPAHATIELEDAVWRSATKARATRQEITLAKDPVQIGSDQSGKVAEHFMTTPMGSGVFKSFNPVLDMVKLGILKVIEHPAVDLTLEQMREAIEKAQGYAMPKEVDEELVIKQYHRICE